MAQAGNVLSKVLVHRVQCTIAPQGWQRQRAAPPEGRTTHGALHYDFDTLFYQATRVGTDIVLIAPKLLNFAKLLRRTRFSVGGVPLTRWRARNYYRHSTVIFKDAPLAADLDISFPDGTRTQVSVVPTACNQLAGLDCELIISKDNDLCWIEERIAFHTSHCGIEGLCFVDNGSSAYDLDDLVALFDASDLQRAVLVSMPFPFGGLNARSRHCELYLQTSAYNLCKLQFLSSAKAVVLLDVDEVLLPQKSGCTVFDLARRSPFGFVRFGGSNRLPGAKDQPPFEFKHHSWMRPGKEASHKTWSIVPTGPLGRFQWRCHNLERNIFARWQTLPGEYFYHCLGIGTGWKGKNRARPGCELVLDTQAATFWSQTFNQATAIRPERQKKIVRCA